MEPTTTTGRKGSIDNPEVREDVPGHVIPILQREFDDFDNEAEQFLSGATPEDQFIGFRLKQGVYGQRQADVQMIRVKLPWGGITPDQVDTFADVIERYARSPTPGCRAARAAATRSAT
jgi:sulfite reductase beta subunit-like hemoprotein